MDELLDGVLSTFIDWLKNPFSYISGAVLFVLGSRFKKVVDDEIGYAAEWIMRLPFRAVKWPFRQCTDWWAGRADRAQAKAEAQKFDKLVHERVGRWFFAWMWQGTDGQWFEVTGVSRPKADRVMFDRWHDGKRLGDGKRPGINDMRWADLDKPYTEQFNQRVSPGKRDIPVLLYERWTSDPEVRWKEFWSAWCAFSAHRDFVQDWGFTEADVRAHWEAHRPPDPPG